MLTCSAPPEHARTASRVELFGISIDNLSMEEALDRMRAQLSGSGKGYVATPNVDHIVRLQRDEEFREVYRNAALVVPDGMPVLWASRFLGRPLKERVTGSDLVPAVCRIAAELGSGVFFLGGNEGVAEKAAENLARAFPGLRVAGSYAPPCGFDADPEENRKAIDAVRRSNADLLFIALGAPKQEKWIARHIGDLPVKLALCIGCALDYQAGAAKRAPLWMRRGGLEWLWRIGLEPRRLARRYLVEDMAFLGIFLKEWMRLRMNPG